MTDYRAFGIERDDPDVVKGRAGSPYAIKDYYDIDPDLAVDVNHRMAEFESLVDRTHQHGMKVIIDFVPIMWPVHITLINSHLILKDLANKMMAAKHLVRKMTITIYPASDFGSG